MLGGAIPRRIPWPVIEQWCQARGYDAEDGELLHSCMLEMDTTYLTFMAAKRETK